MYPCLISKDYFFKKRNLLCKSGTVLCIVCGSVQGAGETASLLPWGGVHSEGKKFGKHLLICDSFFKKKCARGDLCGKWLTCGCANEDVAVLMRKGPGNASW